MFAGALLSIGPLTAASADDGDSAEAWAEKPGFQRGEGGPAEAEQKKAELEKEAKEKEEEVEKVAEEAEKKEKEAATAR